MISNKVTHLITTIERGGAEKQLLTLASEQVQSGIKVEVIFHTNCSKLGTIKYFYYLNLKKGQERRYN